jgi:hypothetical protein
MNKYVNGLRSIRTAYEDDNDAIGAATSRLIALETLVRKLRRLARESCQFQGDVKVWMHFIARDVGTDRAATMMKSFPRIAAQSEALQKSLKLLGIEYDAAAGERAVKKNQKATP